MSSLIPVLSQYHPANAVFYFFNKLYPASDDSFEKISRSVEFEVFEKREEKELRNVDPK